jgi:hypothetical protein
MGPGILERGERDQRLPDRFNRTGRKVLEESPWGKRVACAYLPMIRYARNEGSMAK